MIWNQIEIRSAPNQSENGKHNLIPVLFNKIQKIFIRVYNKYDRNIVVKFGCRNFVVVFLVVSLHRTELITVITKALQSLPKLCLMLTLFLRTKLKKMSMKTGLSDITTYCVVLLRTLCLEAYASTKLYLILTIFQNYEHEN